MPKTFRPAPSSFRSMLYATLKTLHLLSVIVWVGGMVFVQFILRPALGALDGPQRLVVMQTVLGRFFNTVLVAAGLAVGTGFWMMGRAAGRTAQFGVATHMPLEWLFMAGLGMLMVLVFTYVRWALYPRLVAAVATQGWAEGAAVLATLRRWVLLNLVLGVLTVAVAQLGTTG